MVVVVLTAVPIQACCSVSFLNPAGRRLFIGGFLEVDLLILLPLNHFDSGNSVFICTCKFVTLEN